MTADDSSHDGLDDEAAASAPDRAGLKSDSTLRDDSDGPAKINVEAGEKRANTGRAGNLPEPDDLAGNSGEHSPLTNIKDLAAGLRDVTIVLGIYCFYSGFVYLHFFYNSLSVDTTVVELSPQEILSYSFSPIWAHRFELLFFLFILSSIYYAVHYFRTQKTYRLVRQAAGLVVVDVFIIAVASTLLAHYVFRFASVGGADTAVHARTGKSTLQIKFILSERNRYGARFACFNDNQRLLLAAESKEYYFVVGGGNHADPNRVAAQPLFRIPKKDVLVAEVALPPDHTSDATPIPVSSGAKRASTPKTTSPVAQHQLTSAIRGVSATRTAPRRRSQEATESVCAREMRK